MAIVDGRIACSTCREPKALSAYAPSVVAKGCGVCRDCKRVALRAYQKTPHGRAMQLARYHRAAPSGRPENTRLKTRYGITLAEFHAMIATQGGRCACCGEMSVDQSDSTGKRALYVDHCHETGVVRGLLCPSCNTGLGQFKDDVDRLRSAIAYLERAQQPPLMQPTPSMRINLLRGAN